MSASCSGRRPNVRAEFPQYPAHEEYDDLLTAISAALDG